MTEQSGAAGDGAGSDVDTVTVLGHAQQLAWRRRVLPPVERLATGLWSVPVPIPDSPLRYTLSYLVPGDAGLVVVDPGWDSPPGWDALTAGLSAAGASPDDVVGIVATHVHPDHHGLSGRLRDASGAWIAMHPAEAQTLPQRARSLADGRRDDPQVDSRGVITDWLKRLSGAPAEAIAQMLSAFTRPTAGQDSAVAATEPATAAWRPMSEPDVLLEHGSLVPLPGRRLRAVWTPGHTPGHLCLADEDARQLLTGDHVLPRITPNIGARPDSARPMLRLYLESLRAVRAFDDHDVLPAHEFRFGGIAARASEIAEHHESRCAEIVDAVAVLGAPTLWELAEQLTWSRAWVDIGPMRIAALGETAAHVELLVERGQVRWNPRDTPARVRLRQAA